MNEKPTYEDLMKQVKHLNSRVNQLELELEQHQLKSQGLKSSFLSSVSYELRNPMNAVLGFSNLMVDRDLSPKQQQEYLSHITNNSNKLLNLVDSLIDVSLIEANELNLKKEDVRLNELLQQLHFCFNMERHKQGKDHLALLFNKGSKNKDFTAFTDATRIKQVLSILLHNSLRYTDRGIIEFGYEVFESEGKLKFFVRDSGKGILYSKSQSIFEKIEKSNSNSEENNPKPGLELELGLVRGLVKLLGGDLWMKTNIINGTTFHFTIDFLKVNYSSRNLFKASRKTILV